MNKDMNWKLRKAFTGNNTSDVQTINGYIAAGEDNDFSVEVSPVGKEYPAPLFIPRTNLVLQSNQFDTTWSKTNVSVTSGQAGYDGTSDAWKIEGTGSSVFSYLDQADTTTHVKTKSIYAKAGSVDWISIWSASSNKAYFDLANGTTGVLAGPYVIDSSITSVGGGWYRCEVAMTESSAHFYIIPATSDNGTSLSAGEYVYIQDAQLEAGSVATEYIPTTTAAVTRDWSAFGRVQNQLPGICNGTHTHTGAASGSGIAATTLTGTGSGGKFKYEFDTLGKLVLIEADDAGQGYRVDDKLSITTNEGHDIEFRLVEGSNATTITVGMEATKPSKPVPFPVTKMRVADSTDRRVLIIDQRSRYVFPKPTPYLLDTYEGAAAAYSLRRLRSAYTGPAVRVRRASNNDELDIYFDGQGNLDTAALEAFCAGTNGFVKVWYDQSASGADLEQTSTARQGVIVSSGTVLVDADGLPYVNAIQSTYDNPVQINQPFTAFAAAQFGVGYRRLMLGGVMWSPDLTNNRFNGGLQLTGTNALNFANKELYGILANGASSEMRYNGTSDATGNVGTNAISTSTTIFSQAAPSNAGPERAYEMVIFSGDQSANFTGIEDNINDYYNIY